MAENRTPQWHSIAKLPLIAQHIEAMLAEDNQQYHTLQEARPRPHILDDHTVNHLIQVYAVQRNDLGLFEEQLRRWKAQADLTSAQHLEVERCQGQLKRLQEVNSAILALADELKEGTIEKILAKSDLELGLEMLQPKPARTQPRQPE